MQNKLRNMDTLFYWLGKTLKSSLVVGCHNKLRTDMYVLFIDTYLFIFFIK